MEYNHKFSDVSSYTHKFGFDRNVLEYQQYNPLVSLPPPSLPSEETKEQDISKNPTTKKRKTKK